MSQPAYPGVLRTRDVAQRLGEATAGPAHAFWPDDIDPLADNRLHWDRILGHRQVTDAYLLALAVRHEGRFVTFDQRIGIAAVQGAGAQHLVILA